MEKNKIEMSNHKLCGMLIADSDESNLKVAESFGGICDRIQESDFYLQDMDAMMQTKIEKKHILLHSCCGPCSTACIERLLPDYHITVFFYNPNITDTDEYERRKAAQIQFLTAYNAQLDQEDRVRFIEGEYLPEDYFAVCAAYSDEPEGGKRCTECFKLRMERTAQVALKTGNQIFGTTLTVSPHKNYPLISAIGTELAKLYKLEFLDMDFKKKAGFQRSIELSKEYELYRQNYCGCEYSKWEGYDKPKAPKTISEKNDK